MNLATRLLLVIGLLFSAAILWHGWMVIKAYFKGGIK